MHADSDLSQGLLRALPKLRRFALSLCKEHELAADLVQETACKALAGGDGFVQGTNLDAWLFTILRNCYLSRCRTKGREVGDPDGVFASTLSTPPNQYGWLDAQDFAAAFSKLPAHQREALIMVGAEGLAFEEAAILMGVAVGTAKSRVIRGRARLAELLG